MKIWKSPVAIEILSVFKSPICRRIGLLVLLVALVIDLSIAGFVFMQKRAAFERDLHERAVTYVRSAVDVTAFPDIDRLVRFGENISAITDVAGGIYVNSIGEEAGRFGETPWLDWRTATRGGTRWALDEDGAAFETFVKPSETGLSYGLLLRLDSSEAWATLIREFVHSIIAAVAVALGIALLVVALVAAMVLRRTRRITEAVEHALKAPERADQHVAKLDARDEIGALGCMLDELLFLVATTYVEDLATAYAINEQSPGALLTFSGDGHLVFANAAALRMFKASSVEELALQEDAGFIMVQGKPRPATDLIARGRFFGPAEAIVGGDKIPCLSGGDRVLRADGTLSRYFLMMVNVQTFVAEMRRERAMRKSAEEVVSGGARTVESLEERLEAATLLLALERSTDDGAADGARPRLSVRPDIIVTKWLREAAEAGKIEGGRMTHERLPPVLVHTTEVEKLFTIALTMVRARSQDPQPLVEVLGGFWGEERAGFRIRELAKPGLSGKTAKQSRAADIEMQTAALSALASREGGMLINAISEPGEPNELRFALLADLKLARQMDGSFSANIFDESLAA